jgi:hypothetical protein
MLALWHSAVLALALTRTPLVPSRCGGVTMAAQTIRGSFLALRKKVKGTISPEQMDAITNVEQFAESTVQIAESKVQIAEEQKRSARKEVKLLEEKEELLEANIAFMAKDRRTLLLALARYRCVLENRALLEANAQALYKTESLTSTNAQVQKLINEKARSSRV